jgi:hypothetical protein
LDLNSSVNYLQSVLDEREKFHPDLLSAVAGKNETASRGARFRPARSAGPWAVAEAEIQKRDCGIDDAIYFKVFLIIE